MKEPRALVQLDFRVGLFGFGTGPGTFLSGRRFRHRVQFGCRLRLLLSWHRTPAPHDGHSTDRSPPPTASARSVSSSSIAAINASTSSPSNPAARASSGSSWYSSTPHSAITILSTDANRCGITFANAAPLALVEDQPSSATSIASTRPPSFWLHLFGYDGVVPELDDVSVGEYHVEEPVGG